VIELHRHLEGSVRVRTLFEAAQEFRLPMLSDRLEDWRRYYELTDEDPPGYTNFFCKPGFLRRFFVRREIIERVAREAVEDARAEGVTRLELRYSPAFLAAAALLNPQDVVEWVAGACRVPGIEVTFIATLSRAHSHEINAPTVEVALGTDRFVGLDLAGFEPASDGTPYADVFRRAREQGLGVTVHAAEHPDTGANARIAVERLGATRLGHGLHVSPKDLAWLVDRGIVFEMCPESNRRLGVWDPAAPHPAAAFLKRGARVTLNTDNPRILQTRLSDQFELAGLAKERAQAIAREALFV
jgi:adenosine deaminase